MIGAFLAVASVMIATLTAPWLATWFAENVGNSYGYDYAYSYDYGYPAEKTWADYWPLGSTRLLVAFVFFILSGAFVGWLLGSSGGDVAERDEDVRMLRDRIDRDYAQPLDVEALARGVHVSAGHLSRQFKAAYGESPYSYLMTRRVERAMALLRIGELSVTEVCFAVGFSSLGTFSTRFSELVGVPPSVYREEARRTTSGPPACVEKRVSRPVRNREALSPRVEIA